MDDYRVVSLFGAGSCQFASSPDLSAAVTTLRRKVFRLHLQHLGASLLRMLVAAGLGYLAYLALGSPWSHVLWAASGLLSVHALLFGVRGHAKITRGYRARLYWLRAPGIDQDLSPVYMGTEQPESQRKAG